MLIDTDNLVTKDGFCQEPDKYIAAARAGCGPVAITEDSKVVGFFIGLDEYEAVFGIAVRKLLAGRDQGPTVSHDQVTSSIRRKLQRHRAKS